MLFGIYENDKLLFSESCDEIITALQGDNGMFIGDLNNMFEYYKKHGRSSDDKLIAADVMSIADSSLIDGEHTKAVFWLAAVMVHYGVHKKISHTNGVKIYPGLIAMTTANTKSHDLKLKRSMQIRDFLAVYIEEQKSFAANGHTDPDAVAERLIKALPEPYVTKAEIAERPDFMRFINSVADMAKCCADPSLSAAMEEYTDKIK